MENTIKTVNNLQTLLSYCSSHLQWPIDEDWFEDIDDIVYEFDANDLGIKPDEFARIKSVKQLQPLVDNQPWGIFAVDFESKRLEVSALRRILRCLIPSRNNNEFKTWDYNNLLFLCFWGEDPFRTVGFATFHATEIGLPTLKVLYCTPSIEDRSHLENFEGRLKKLSWPNINDHQTWLSDWNEFSVPSRGQTIRDSAQLTGALAATAVSISSILLNMFSIESENGFAHRLYHRFNNALKITLSQQDFVDMYAQTIVYGLFSARCMHPEYDEFNVRKAVDCIPSTNPLLKQLLAEYESSKSSDSFDELEINQLVDLLSKTDIDNILKDFNRQTGLGREDPIVYFYERFLDIYEKEEKKRRGVYYTPTPAVNFIVKSISQVLRQEFGCKAGFLNEIVSVLDPATGTGTFLRSVILEAYDEYQKTFGENRTSWSQFVSDNLLPRIYGLEFMMAPYAVAHMKLAMTLKETGYEFPPNKRLQVYLANSLECGDEFLPFENDVDPLLRESCLASRVKNSHINVIIGNPPYRTDSVNKSEWIMSLMETYKHEPGEDGRLRERNPKVINDDYVKFIRFAQEVVKNEDNAIIGYITPHSFTDNLTFRGMRWSLLHSFDSIYIFDLHGNVMSREATGQDIRDENIFDIQQGVSICFFIKKGSVATRNAKVFYSDIFGTRVEKYNFLSRTCIGDISWRQVTPTAPYYFFKPKDLTEADNYNCGINLSELFPVFLGGIKTHDDEHLVSKNAFDTGNDQYYDYRPFDVKHIDYNLTKVERPRYEVMKHFIGHNNYGLVMDRQVVTDNWSHIQIVRNMIDNRVHYSRKGIPVECPMFLYEGNSATPNIDREQLSIFSKNLDLVFSPSLTEQAGSYDMLDIYDYCYAILNSNLYREKYRELLSIDFPRVPIPTTNEDFLSLCLLGSKLRRLHLLDTDIHNSIEIVFCGTGDNVISALKYEDERVYINRNQYFTNIGENLWNFCFGGYHGLQKWFKDRRQQPLTSDDINHIIKVYNVFNMSEIIMENIDDYMSAHGII